MIDAHLYVFDLLYMDGFDIRTTALVGRKRVLQAMLGAAQIDRLVSASISRVMMLRSPPKLARGLEGIISPYLMVFALARRLSQTVRCCRRDRSGCAHAAG